MKDIETKTAIVDFLIMIMEKSSSDEEYKALAELDIDERRKFVVQSFLKENRVVKLKKQPSNSPLMVDRTKISVRCEKDKVANKRTTYKWIIYAPKYEKHTYETYDYEEKNSEIVKILTGSIIALKRNNHHGDRVTESRDMLATLAIYFCITENEERLLEFLTFLARNYDIMISAQADIVIEAIYKIITWQGDDFRETRRKIARSSVLLSVQSNLAKNANFRPGTLKSTGLFTTNLDDFSVRKAVYDKIEAIECECASSGYNWRIFNNILNKRIEQAQKKGDLLEKSVLEGIKFARQGNQLSFEESTLDSRNADLINPDINLYFLEIIKLASAFLLMNNAAKIKCLTTLITYAKDFSVSRRSVQECAIHTLVYLLYEHFEFPTTKAEIAMEIFEAAYSKVTYAMMDYLLDGLDAQSGKYFFNIIKNAYEKAINHNAQPLYFFYYHRVVDPKNKFISDCHQFRAVTRVGTKDGISDYINFAKKRILNNENYIEWKNEKEYLYAMQSFFYGLANIAMLCDHGKNEVLALLKYKPEILRRQIAVDFYTRKSVFGEIIDSNGDLSTFIHSGDFYLLCGPTRLACSLNDSTLNISSDELHKNFGIQKSSLISTYQKCLIAENGRYKLLLYKLLSVIKDFDYQAPDGKHCLVNCRFVNEKDFLNYDNVDILTINKKLIELKEKST